MKDILFRVLICLFCYGVGFLSPTMGNLFIIPLYYMFLREDKVELLSLVFLFAILLDIQEGLFPINFIFIPIIFLFFVFQKFIPYLQDRVFFQLGFVTLITSFFVGKIVLVGYFYDFYFSYSLLLNFIILIVCFSITELLMLVLKRNKETKTSVRF
ncbi:MAG: hypothetical protein ACTSXL_03855 [Alphaproteobacteria bacterium]|nr:MAG: hypothetical protein B6I23_02305 [Rickettsiaceae bacterium 4572_127]